MPSLPEPAHDVLRAQRAVAFAQILTIDVQGHARWDPDVSIILAKPDGQARWVWSWEDIPTQDLPAIATAVLSIIQPRFLDDSQALDLWTSRPHADAFPTNEGPFQIDVVHTEHGAWMTPQLSPFGAQIMDAILRNHSHDLGPLYRGLTEQPYNGPRMDVVIPTVATLVLQRPDSAHAALGMVQKARGLHHAISSVVRPRTVHLQTTAPFTRAHTADEVMAALAKA